MTARLIPSTKLPNTRKEKNHSLLKVEEDTTTSREDSVVRRNQFSKRRPKLPRRLLWNSSVPNANTRDYFVLEELRLLSSKTRRKINNALIISSTFILDIILMNKTTVYFYSNKRYIKFSLLISNYIIDSICMDLF